MFSSKVYIRWVSANGSFLNNICLRIELTSLITTNGDSGKVVSLGAAEVHHISENLNTNL
jgi:hypothetical protein